jgi:hypothetical protein
MQLPAPATLRDLRALILGDHALELAQQLVLRCARALSPLHEHDLDPAARELLEQQHLVGVAARETIRRVAQHDLEAALDRAVAKPLQRRALRACAGEPIVLNTGSFGTSNPRCSASSRSAAV